MNIVDSGRTSVLSAKTCGSLSRGGKVIYSFDDDYHMLFVDKKEIIQNQLEACQRLLPYVSGTDKAVVEKEILELKMVLDLVQ